MNTKSNETQSSDNKLEANMSPYFPASVYRPMMVGPFRCKMVGAFDDGSGSTHMRWWDGQYWSFPLQPEHETLDDEFIKPIATYFVREEIEVYLGRFAWCGFNEDQEPL